jgi:predicted small secreted protein
MHRKTISIIATTTALAFCVAACGDDSGSGKSSSSSSSSQAVGRARPPEPVAKIDALSGRSTAVALDSGFVDALGT